MNPNAFSAAAKLNAAAECCLEYILQRGMKSIFIYTLPTLFFFFFKPTESTGLNSCITKEIHTGLKQEFYLVKIYHYLIK